VTAFGVSWLVRHPRVLSAIAFGLAGAALPMSWYLPSLLHAHGPIPAVLFVGVPGLSGAVAGGLFAQPLLTAGGVRSVGRAGLLGAAIATVALLLFAPTFAALYVWMAPPAEHGNVLGLTVLILTGAAIAAWAPAVVIGAAIGIGLYRLRSRGGA
jgi:hypothetical protein